MIWGLPLSFWGSKLTGIVPSAPSCSPRGSITLTSWTGLEWQTVSPSLLPWNLDFASLTLRAHRMPRKVLPCVRLLTSLLLVLWCILPPPLTQILPTLLEYWPDSTPTLDGLVGFLSNISCTTSRVPWTTASPISLILCSLRCLSLSLMQIMVDARILVAPLEDMWSRWILVRFLALLSFKMLLLCLLLKLST